MIKNIALSLLVGLLAGVTFIISIEAIYASRWKSGWVDTNTDYHASFGWSNLPSRQSTQPWGVITHNSLGFRSQELDATMKKIVLLGDSVAWGYGVNDQETIGAKLQEEVGEVGYQVVNLGVSGFGLDQTYLWLKYWAPKIKNLDYVILILNAENDLLDVASNSRYGKSKPLFILQDGQLMQHKEVLSKYSLRNIFTRSIILRKLYDLHPKMREWFIKIAGDVEITETQSEAVAERFILEIASLSRKVGAKFYVLNSPSLVDFIERPIGYQWAEETLEKNGYDRISIRNALASQFLNLTDAYYDEEHFSPEGSALVARQIHAKLFQGKI